jgi:hypothetical protein
VLWIAVLVGVTAATAAVVLISHTGQRERVTPLRDDKTNSKPRGERSEARQENGGLASPRLRSGIAGEPAQNGRTRRASHRSHRRNRGAARPDARKHEGIRPVQSTSPGSHQSPVAQQPSPVAVPVALPVSAPSSGHPETAEPTRPQRSQDQTIPSPSPAADDEDAVEIEIKDGELHAPDRIRPHDGHLTLRVRSDQFVIVDVEGSVLTWPVLAGQVALITVDGKLKKHFEAVLVRRAGVLVLRLDD